MPATPYAAPRADDDEIEVRSGDRIDVHRLEEVLGLAHRVFVMRRGRMVAEYSSDQATMDRVLAAAFATEAA